MARCSTPNRSPPPGPATGRCFVWFRSHGELLRVGVVQVTASGPAQWPSLLPGGAAETKRGPPLLCSCRGVDGSMAPDAEVIAFQCGRLALPYKPEAAQGITTDGLATSCREDYDPGAVPPEASVIVAAVDVQDNRLEAEITAWGVVEVASRQDASAVKGWGSHEFRGLAHEGKWYRLRRWALDYRRFHGDPGNAEFWENLAEFIETPIPHATGPLLRPVTVGIDIGGHYGGAGGRIREDPGRGLPVFEGLAARPLRRGPGAAIGHRRLARDLMGRTGCCWYAATAARRLRSLSPAPVHRGARSPGRSSGRWTSPPMGQSSSRGIVSETLMRTLDKRTGATRLMWRKINRANEPLDVLMYSLALCLSPGPGFHARRGRRHRQRRRPNGRTPHEPLHRHRRGVLSTSTRTCSPGSRRGAPSPASRRGAPSPRSPR